MSHVYSLSLCKGILVPRFSAAAEQFSPIMFYSITTAGILTLSAIQTTSAACTDKLLKRSDFGDSYKVHKSRVQFSAAEVNNDWSWRDFGGSKDTGVTTYLLFLDSDVKGPDGKPLTEVTLDSANRNYFPATVQLAFSKSLNDYPEYLFTQKLPAAVKGKGYIPANCWLMDSKIRNLVITVQEF